MRVPFKVAVAGCLALLLSLAGGVASAAWRDEVQKLRIGVLAGGDSAYRVATLEPFRIYLQDRTGYNFGTLARMVADERMTKDQIEIVWR
ncbi:MAG: hypothetical protein RLO48_04540, partial [Bauldia litoralis]